nr:hypothetical protein [Flavobacteriales bacterium]
MNRHTLLLTGLATLLIACGEGDGTTTDQYGRATPGMSELEARVAAATGRSFSDEQGQEQLASAGFPGGGSAPEGTRTYTVNSSTLKVPFVQLDLPAHWNVQGMETGDWTASAPGLKVRNSKPANFIFVGGEMGQFYRASGQAMRAPVAPEQVVQQDIASRLQQQGYQLLGLSPAPGVERIDQQGMSALYVSGQVQRTCKANVSEWKRGDKRLAVVLHWFNLASADMANWGYYTTELEAAENAYEREKAALLNALGGMRYNPGYFAAQRQLAQQKEQQQWALHNQQMQNNQASWNAHNARMRSNQVAFDASQAAHRDMVNSVNNSQMSIYNSTNSSMDRMQGATIDAIRGEQNAWNPNTGQQGKVEAGYNNYWVNGDGQYFGTNDVLYDPNVNGQWVD